MLPKNAGGADLGPAPPELILAAYAGCVGSIGRIIAFQEKITLRGMTFEVEADYDPDRLLGRETTARSGFQEMRLKVKIDADLDDEAKQAFLDKIEERCPVGGFPSTQLSCSLYSTSKQPLNICVLHRAKPAQYCKYQARHKKTAKFGGFFH